MSTQMQINTINMSRVLRSIRLNRGCSRADMCRELGLNKSTVTKNVQVLLDRGIVEEIREGEAGPQGGRRPVALGIRQDFCYILGLEIQTESYRAVICNARGEQVFSRTGRLTGGEPSLMDYFRRSFEELKPYLDQFRVLGIALGLSGVVNTEEGMIRHSMSFGIKEPLDFARQAGRLAGMPVLIENDANCGCWGDLAGQKAGREENSLFLLSEFREADTRRPGHPSLSVGMGLVLGGKVHYGKDFSAGEFTSVLRPPGGKGQFFLDGEPLGRDWPRRETALDLIREIAGNLAFLVNSLNLSRIVIGGTLEDFPDELPDILDRRIQEAWPYEDRVDCQIDFSRRGDLTVAYGACSYFLERIFGLPDVEDSSRRGWAFLLDCLSQRGRGA